LLTNKGERFYPYWDRIVTADPASHSNTVMLPPG